MKIFIYHVHIDRNIEINRNIETIKIRTIKIIEALLDSFYKL